MSVNRSPSAAGSIPIATRAACCSLDLRDRYGKTQAVFTPERGDETLKQSKALRAEDVILVRGDVARRPEGTVNPKLETGEIEVRVRHVEILNKSARRHFSPAAQICPAKTCG